MSSNTPNLGLLKKDPMVDGNETFNIETMLNDNWDKIDEAVGRTGGYGETTQAVANAYEVQVSPAPVSLAAGMRVTIKVDAASTGSPTLNVNGLGDKPVLKPSGNGASLKENGVYTLVFDGQAFILQGEGGAEAGTATAKHVLVGKTVGTEDGFITGTLAPRVPNLLKNGSFEYGSNAWEPDGDITGVSFPTTNKKYGATSFYQAKASGRHTQRLFTTIGSKYYMSGWGYFQSINAGYNMFGALRQTSGSAWLYPTTGTLALNQWVFGSTIVTAASELFADVGVWGDNRATGLFVDGLMVINLTAAFGAGQEPAQSEMDAIIHANGGYWESDIGTLTADAVLDPAMLVSGYSGYDDGLKKTGTMVDNSLTAMSARGQEYTTAISTRGDGQGSLVMEPPTAYYTAGKNNRGFGSIIAQDLDYRPDNIRAGVDIFGVVGTMAPSVSGSVTINHNLPMTNVGSTPLISNIVTIPAGVLSLQFWANGSNPGDGGWLQAYDRVDSGSTILSVELIDDMGRVVTLTSSNAANSRVYRFGRFNVNFVTNKVFFINENLAQGQEYGFQGSTVPGGFNTSNGPLTLRFRYVISAIGWNVRFGGGMAGTLIYG